MAEIGVSIQHDANHGAYSRNTVLEYMLGTTLDIIGASSFMWKQQHVVGHHTYTNVDGLDPDIRVKDPDVRRVSQHQPWQAYQVSYAVSLTCRLFCGWRSLGVLTAQAGIGLLISEMLCFGVVQDPCNAIAHVCGSQIDSHTRGMAKRSTSAQCLCHYHHGNLVDQSTPECMCLTVVT